MDEFKVEQFHTISVEYHLAFNELQRVQPHYVAAVKRYADAKAKLAEHIADNDSHINLI